MAIRTDGGLDVCSVCGDQLSLSELLHVWETDNTCNVCLAIIEKTKEEIDENISKKNK